MESNYLRQRSKKLISMLLHIKTSSVSMASPLLMEVRRKKKKIHRQLIWECVVLQQNIMQVEKHVLISTSWWFLCVCLHNSLIFYICTMYFYSIKRWFLCSLCVWLFGTFRKKNTYIKCSTQKLHKFTSSHFLLWPSKLIIFVAWIFIWMNKLLVGFCLKTIRYRFSNTTFRTKPFIIITNPHRNIGMKERINVTFFLYEPFPVRVLHWLIVCGVCELNTSTYFGRAKSQLFFCL